MGLNTWYTTKVKYIKQLDNGALKRVTESYLVAALSFTDAEARIYEELGQIIRGEFKVSNITPVEISDIFNYDDCGEWFRAKIHYDSLDTDRESAKNVTLLILIEAENIKDADERLRESLSKVLGEFKVSELKESKIIDIFPHKDQEKK